MSDVIRLSCDCQIRQGEGFVHLCPAHSDLIAAEREACAEIAENVGVPDGDQTKLYGPEEQAWANSAERIAQLIRERSTNQK